MPVTGRKPKPEGQKVTRHALTQEWVEVADVPYEGEKPSPGSLTAATKRWWEVVSSMPHCVLWTPADWQFALDTALIHAAFSKGDLARAQELRVREKVLGTTLDARRDLRIRYVPVAEEDAEKEPDKTIDFERERTRRLSGA